MRCTNANCVGVLLDNEDVYIWDTKEAVPVQLRFDREEWESFTNQVKAGKYDLAPLEIDAEEVSPPGSQRFTISV
jgi:hypothetical protein